MLFESEKSSSTVTLVKCAPGLVIKASNADDLEKDTRDGWSLNAVITPADGDVTYLVSRSVEAPPEATAAEPGENEGALADVVRTLQADLREARAKYHAADQSLAALKTELSAVKSSAWAAVEKGREEIRREMASREESLLDQMRAREPIYQRMLGLTRDLAEFNVHQGNLADRLRLRIDNASEILRLVKEKA